MTYAPTLAVMPEGTNLHKPPLLWKTTHGKSLKANWKGNHYMLLQEALQIFYKVIKEIFADVPTLD